MRRALIVGLGYTGQQLARGLLAEGIPVSGTCTGPAGPDAPCEVLPLDLLRPEALDLPGAAGAVVYYLVPTLFRRYEPGARPHLAPLRRLLAAVAPHGVRGLVYLSSTSVYGDTGGGWVDEQTPVAPQTPWARMRVELEQEVWSFGQRQGLPACVVRCPEIYGPGRGPVARLRAGYVLRFPHRYSNRIHVQDLAAVLSALGRRLQPPLLLAADDLPATSAEVYGHAAALLGRGEVPTGPADGGDENRLGLLSESKRCCNRQLRAWLGRPLCYPTYREGLAATC